MIEIGSELEFALWYDANEHLDPINSCSASIKDTLDIICAKNKIIHGNINYEILKVGDDRVPLVPRWLEVIDGALPKLLVATTKITGNDRQESMGIIGDLDKKDVVRLRVITKRQYHKVYPKDNPLTDHECDQIIDKLGLEVVMDQLGSNAIN